MRAADLVRRAQGEPDEVFLHLQEVVLLANQRLERWAGLNRRAVALDTDDADTLAAFRNAVRAFDAADVDFERAVELAAGSEDAAQDITLGIPTGGSPLEPFERRRLVP